MRKTEDKNKRLKTSRKAEIANAKRIGDINRSIDNGGSQQGPDYNWDFAEAIDPSHAIARVHPSSNAMYCQRCSYYNNGGLLKRLKEPCCQNIPKHRASLLNMLKSGNVPKGGEHAEDSLSFTNGERSVGLPLQEGREIPSEWRENSANEREIPS